MNTLTSTDTTKENVGRCLLDNIEGKWSQEVYYQFIRSQVIRHKSHLRRGVWA